MKTIILAGLLAIAGPAVAQSPVTQDQLAIESLRAQQFQQSLDAQIQAGVAAQQRLQTQQELQELELDRSRSATPGQPQAPVAGGSRIQPRRDSAPELSAPPPVQPSSPPPSDANSRGNLPL